MKWHAFWGSLFPSSRKGHSVSAVFEEGASGVASPMSEVVVGFPFRIPISGVRRNEGRGGLPTWALFKFLWLVLLVVRQREVQAQPVVGPHVKDKKWVCPVSDVKRWPWADSVSSALKNEFVVPPSVHFREGSWCVISSALHVRYSVGAERGGMQERCPKCICLQWRVC